MISKKLSEHMGGNIVAKSVIGQGSTFTFRIKLNGVRHIKSQLNVQLLVMDPLFNRLARELP